MVLDSESIKEVSVALKARGESIAVAESTTGGLISARLLSMPGASAYFSGGTIIYTRASRKIFLDASAEKLEGVKPMSEEMAQFFARQVREKLAATWGIAELGIAGPTGSAYGYEAGNSVIAVSGPIEAAVRINTGHNDRARNMEEFTECACQLLKDVLSR
ncbi:MAG: CinA family protein [Pseudomonadales bacterium]|jgi:PncC family amidohydrolase|nr:CinA family protein [Pseudomonadales bacterium]|tara:strand:- start:1020 stop:1502 length:483 start_codon:yes stop_codon:yes gene_type:complete